MATRWDFLEIVPADEQGRGVHEQNGGSRGRSATVRSTSNADGGARDSKYVILSALKITISILFSVTILTATVMSKLTLVSLTESLRKSFQTLNGSSEDDPQHQTARNNAIALYWQILLILLIPNGITFLRCVFFGFLGKTRKSYPWPTVKAGILGLVSSVFEVIAMSIFVYLVLSELHPAVSILVLNGVFFAHIAIDLYSSYYKKTNCNPNNYQNQLQRREYTELNENNEAESDPFVTRDPVVNQDRNKLYHKMKNPLKVAGFLLQLIGLVSIFFFCFMVEKKENEYSYLRPLIALPLVLLVMSIIWSNRFQEATAKPYLLTCNKVSSRYKSAMINSFVRIVLYPFVTYLVFRYLTHLKGPRIDPWCLKHKCEINLHSDTMDTMILHIVLSFVGYGVVWISCTMTLSPLTIGIPLLISTPLTIVVHYISQGLHHFFLQFTDEPIKNMEYVFFLLWIGEVLAMGYFICTVKNIILAKDHDMFLMPHYDSIFLEQHIILNRKPEKLKQDDRVLPNENAGKRTIFICSTMYRENEVEMQQMLKSIFRVAEHYGNDSNERNNANCDSFESHIFFDGAINANQIENFGLQLLSLLEKTFTNIKLKYAIKEQTPYGYRLYWTIGLMGNMPFYIHFKDKNLVKPKKRWSQVMYMNYVLNHRIITDNLNAEDTFILTTDADIDFTADSAVVLLDMLAPNRNVAAVCARTHPKGHGPVYWYQLFDYAIGHWFQKPAEHILGSVLCSPGCFSVFRCSALKLVLEEYSSEVNNASEFLMKDMGEDRWLCTLLIKQGLRLEYCAISEDQTYCPVDFDEFYKQRRRWIPSTVANLFMLVSESGVITKGNDSISILYIIFQAIMIFSTAIAPATVILVISAGLQTFHVPPLLTTITLSILSVLYGLICLLASPKTQLDVAKLLTFIFALIMSIVVIGIFKDIVDNLAPNPAQILIEAPNCDRFNVTSKDYENCAKGQNFASHSNNSAYHQFHLGISTSTIYMAVLTSTFILAGLLHLPEISCLLHGIWFLLALPSGYLLLLIYSAANLCDRSWGTREHSTGADEGLWGWRRYIIKAWNKLILMWCCIKCYTGGTTEKEKIIDVSKEKSDESGKGEKDGKKKVDSDKMDAKHETDGSKKEEDSVDLVVEEGTSEDSGTMESSLVEHVGMHGEAWQWLSKLECETYVDKFQQHGYTNTHFIADMTHEDFIAIGVDKEGFRLRLERAAKKLRPLQFEFRPPRDVAEWLKNIELEEYVTLFHHEGYKWDFDIPNMKELDEEKLKSMGIRRRAHLQRLLKALGYLSKPQVKYSPMDATTIEWLRVNECEEYAEKFASNGYTNVHFIAGMTAKDLQDIGIDKKGFRLRLEKSAQLLPSLPIEVKVPDSVEKWLEELQLSEYTELFHREGYKKAEDIVNLKELNVTQLQAMGIKKKAHLQRLKTGLNRLAKPSLVELNKRRTKGIVDKLQHTMLEGQEARFWTDLIERKLKPVSQKFTQIEDIQKSLESLRNSTLALILLINLMWIVLLWTLTFKQLQRYGIDPRAFELLFLAVYGIIIMIQFLTMIAHRGVTLIHYLGRVKSRAVISHSRSSFQMLSVDQLSYPAPT